MPDLRLAGGLHLRPTPLGAYHATSSQAETPAARLVRRLLCAPVSPRLTPGTLTDLTGLDRQEATALLAELQDLAWVEGHDQPVVTSTEPLETLLPRLLRPLSSRRQALLGDQHGFCLSSVGFPTAAATRLSALAADLASTLARHADVLRPVAGAGVDAWGAIDGLGNCHLGFWPLFIGGQRFALAIAGLPRLNRPELTELISTLSIRYGRDESLDHLIHDQGSTDA